MKRRLFQGVLVLVILSVVSGCSTVGSTANCGDHYRDLTISQIEQQNQDIQFNLAGKITEKRPGQDWMLISDGTGVAKVHTFSSDELMNQPTDKCIEFSAYVGSVANGENVDVVMYLGEYIGS